MASDDELALAVRYSLRDLPVKRATEADVDAIVLRLHGLAPLAQRLWREGHRVSSDARRSVDRRLREKFGLRNPRSGLFTIGVFILALSMTAPIAYLLPRLRTPDSAELSANSGAILGRATLVVVLLTLGKPVVRSTFFQLQFIAVVLVGSAVAGTAISGQIHMTAVAGVAVGILSLMLAAIGRARDRAATEDIDNALEQAHLDVAPEVARAREGMLSTLAPELDKSGADLDAMRAMRTAAITAFRAEGSSATDLDPTALPGAYIVHRQTSTWLPVEWPSRIPRGR